MASPFVSGPVQWFVNAGTGKQWLYLGMCEADVSVDLASEWDDVQLDGGGFRLPYDKQFFGATAGVSGDLVRYNHDVLDAVMNWVNNPAATPGQWANGTIGSLVRTEGLDFGLILKSEYATKTVYQEAGAHPLIYFPWVVCTSKRVGKSTRATRERIAFDCNPVLNGLGGGVLYYNSISFSLPAPN